MFHTLADLAKFLTQHGIDTAEYGKGTSKGLEQLLDEVLKGECYFESGGDTMARHVNVLFVSITRADNKVLTEVNQTFHRTSTREEYSRQRNVVLAEKMHKGEDPVDATVRAINEELGILVQDLHTISVTCTTEEKYSPSYPGLLGVYSKATVVVAESELGNTIPDNYTFTEYFPSGEPRVTATWKWM